MTSRNFIYNTIKMFMREKLWMRTLNIKIYNIVMQKKKNC